MLAAAIAQLLVSMVMGWRDPTVGASGGLFALLVRLHLWEPNGTLFENAQYDQIFTLHGAFMVFLFVIPAIPGSLGNMVLPLMLGGDEVDSLPSRGGDAIDTEVTR